MTSHFLLLVDRGRTSQRDNMLLVQFDSTTGPVAMIPGTDLTSSDLPTFVEEYQNMVGYVNEVVP